MARRGGIERNCPSPNKPFYKQTLKDIEEFEKKHPDKIVPFIEENNDTD